MPLPIAFGEERQTPTQSVGIALLYTQDRDYGSGILRDSARFMAWAMQREQPEKLNGGRHRLTRTLLSPLTGKIYRGTCVLDF